MKWRRLASAGAAAIAIPTLGLGLNGAASARTISDGFYARALPGCPPAVCPRSAGHLLGDAVSVTTGPVKTGTVSYNTVTRRSA